MNFAERLKASVTLLHSLPRTVDPILESGVYLLSGGWVPFPEYREKELFEQKRLAEEWKMKADQRQIVRAAHCPVWVLRSDSKNEQKS